MAGEQSIDLSHSRPDDMCCGILPKDKLWKCLAAGGTLASTDPEDAVLARFSAVLAS
jgi:hypothetical protein